MSEHTDRDPTDNENSKNMWLGITLGAFLTLTITVCTYKLWF